MKSILRRLIIMTKYGLFGLVIQCMILNTILAFESNAQYNSVEEVYLSLEMTGQSVEQVFIEIENKTGFTFSYRKRSLSRQKTGKTSFNRKSLASVLRFLSREFDLKFRRIDKNIFVSTKKKNESSISETYPIVEVEDITVSGLVLSDDDTPLPGVNIVIKGTSIGTITDVNGRYTLVAPDNATLVFTYIGFVLQELSLSGRSQVDVIMQEEVSYLSEVVVTTYGTPVERRAVTGAVSSVSGEQFENLPLQSFDKALQGRVSGAQINAVSGQPGGAVDFKIRGVGSVNASNSPLIIIDGVQLNVGGVSNVNSSNALATLNSNDIQSIEILKDAASTAIYGAQGANGVVLISTKTGSKKGPGEFNFTVQQGVAIPVNVYDMLESRELAQLRVEALTNSGSDPTSNFDTHGDPDNTALTTTNWVDEVFRTARTESYDLSFSGGDEKNQYFVAGSYNRQEGTIINTDWERYTFRFNLNASPTEKFTISPRIALSLQETNGTFDGQFVSTNPVFVALAALPSIPVTDEEGNFSDYGALSSTGFPHPVQLMREVVRNSEVFQTVSSFLAKYEIIPSLSASAYAGVNLDKSRNISIFPQSLPLFSGSGGQLFRGDDTRVNFNTYGTINFDETFNNVHQVTGVVGVEYKVLRFESLSTNVSDFQDPSFDLAGSASEIDAVNEVFTKSVRTGVFGKVGYAYNDRYLVDFTLRRDGSSRFSPGKRFGTFYSGAVAWRISGESFMSNQRLIDNLKLRVSSGVTGNSEIGDFQFLQAYSAFTDSRNDYQGQQSIGLTRPSGLPFGWEESLQTNIGLDYGLLEGRIYGLLDFWRKDNRDLLFSKRLPADGGFFAVTANVGKVRNQGIDIEVNSVNLDLNGFRWSSRFNLTLQKNELIELPDGVDRIGNSLIVGEPLDFIFGAEYAGVSPATGRPMWFDQNGDITYQPQQDDLKVIGDFFPDYFGGFSNNFSYKGLSLDVFFQFQGGLDNFSTDQGGFENSGSGIFNNQRRNQLRRWQNPGDITSVPRPFDGGQEPGGSNQNIASTKLLSDGSYIRLKQVTLSYNIPEHLLKVNFLKRARVFIQGINLATLTRSESIDPETVTGSTTRSRNTGNRQVFAVFPTGQIWTGGINITF